MYMVLELGPCLLSALVGATLGLLAGLCLARVFGARGAVVRRGTRAPARGDDDEIDDEPMRAVVRRGTRGAAGGDDEMDDEPTREHHQNTIYVSPAGCRWHIDPDCQGFRFARSVSAKAPCPTCSRERVIRRGP